MNLQPQSTTTAPPPLPPVRPQEITAADAVRMRDGFLHWWHTSLECLVATQKLFRRLDDDDLTALYLAAWQFALEEMEARQPAGPGDRIIAYITQLDASHFEGATVTRYAEVTGIPRETVRRKLDKAASLMLIERVDDAQFRLRAFSTEIMPMFDNCLGLARSLMSCLNRSPTRDGNDLPAATWIALMRSYFILLLSFWAARRRQTRVSSAISIQSVIELVTVLNSYRRLAIEGMASKVDLVTFLQGAPSIRKSPYFISQLAFMSGLTVAQVRRMCRYLETQGKVEFLGPDAIRPLPLVETVSADLQQAFFSEDARIAGMRFVGIALACLAPPRRRLPCRPCVGSAGRPTGAGRSSRRSSRDLVRRDLVRPAGGADPRGAPPVMLHEPGSTPSPAPARRAPARRQSTRLDGRTERSRRTRQALLDAYMLLAGKLRRAPSVQELGAQTGRSIRTIFDRFPSLDALASAAVQQQLSPSPHEVLHNVAGVDRAGRIAFHVGTRMRLCEGWRTAWPVMAEVVRRDPGCAAQLEALTRLERVRTEKVYAPELRLLSESERTERLLTLELLLSVESWIGLREGHRLPVAEAVRYWRRAVARVL